MYIFLTAIGPMITIFAQVGTLGEHLKNRHNPRYWGAVLLPAWFYDSIPGGFLYAALEGMVLYSNGFMLAMVSVSGMTYAALTIDWINKLTNR